MSNVRITRRALLIAGGATVAAIMLRPWRAMAQAMSDTKMRVGIIGSGKIGGTVGALWIKSGHPVLFSSRHPEELAGMVKELGPLAKSGTVADAIAFSDVLLLAIPYGAVPAFGKEYGGSIKGKIILDADNAAAARDGAELAAEVEKNGIGVTSQKYLPGARVVRAFNTLNYLILKKEANRPAPRLAIPLAGDDPVALSTAKALVRDAGFDPVVVGNLADARKIQRGNPGYGQAVSAAELKQKLGVAP